MNYDLETMVPPDHVLRKYKERMLVKEAAEERERWGGKGPKGRVKYWFGYKRHVCVDTSSGLIEKLAVTAANVNDVQARFIGTLNRGRIKNKRHSQLALKTFSKT